MVEMHGEDFRQKVKARQLRLASGSVRGLAFLHVVAVPLGDFDDVGAGLFDDCLAAEARVQLDVRGGLHAVELQVFGLADAACALLHMHVAGGAGADAAAGVVEEDAVVLRHIEEATSAGRAPHRAACRRGTRRSCPRAGR